MSTCCLDKVPEQRGHAGEGECRDGQELPHAEVKVPARVVPIEERSEEVVVVVPRAAEDIRLIDEVLEEWARFWRSGCGVVADAAQRGMGVLGGVGQALDALKPDERSEWGFP
jgi:hypothetical protein